MSLESFEGKSKLSTWIYSIAVNKSKEFLRSKGRKKRFGFHTEIEKEDSHFVPSQIVEYHHPGVALEDKERANILFNAIDQLADNGIQKTYLSNELSCRIFTKSRDYQLVEQQYSFMCMM